MSVFTEWYLDEFENKLRRQAILIMNRYKEIMSISLENPDTYPLAKQNNMEINIKTGPDLKYVSGSHNSPEIPQLTEKVWDDKTRRAYKDLGFTPPPTFTEHQEQLFKNEESPDIQKFVVGDKIRSIRYPDYTFEVTGVCDSFRWLPHYHTICISHAGIANLIIDFKDALPDKASSFPEDKKEAPEIIVKDVTINLTQDQAKEIKESIFAQEVNEVLDYTYKMLIEKNKSYGDSALNPARIFSKADSIEQLKVRIDDKLSRLMRGNEYPGDNEIDDLMGYLTLLKIANNRKGK